MSFVLVFLTSLITLILYHSMSDESSLFLKKSKKLIKQWEDKTDINKNTILLAYLLLVWFLSLLLRCFMSVYIVCSKCAMQHIFITLLKLCNKIKKAEKYSIYAVCSIFKIGKGQVKNLSFLVEVTRFELATPTSRTWCSTKLSHTSITLAEILLHILENNAIVILILLKIKCCFSVYKTQFSLQS